MTGVTHPGTVKLALPRHFQQKRLVRLATQRYRHFGFARALDDSPGFAHRHAPRINMGKTVALAFGEPGHDFYRLADTGVAQYPPLPLAAAVHFVHPFRVGFNAHIGPRFHELSQKRDARRALTTQDATPVEPHRVVGSLEALAVPRVKAAEKSTSRNGLPVCGPLNRTSNTSHFSTFAAIRQFPHSTTLLINRYHESM